MALKRDKPPDMLPQALRSSLNFNRSPALEMAQTLRKSLRGLFRGQSIRVATVTPKCPDTLRLRELGIGRGGRLRLLQKSDPILCAVNDGPRVGMERSLAEHIQILLEPTTDRAKPVGA